jgi:hypothetical protein
VLQRSGWLAGDSRPAPPKAWIPTGKHTGRPGPTRSDRFCREAICRRPGNQLRKSSFACRLVPLSLFLKSLSEAGFVRGFTQIVELALVQPHSSVANGARDGGETFFHVARRTESWRPRTIRAFGAGCKRCLAIGEGQQKKARRKVALRASACSSCYPHKVNNHTHTCRDHSKITKRRSRCRCPGAISSMR